MLPRMLRGLAQCTVVGLACLVLASACSGGDSKPSNVDSQLPSGSVSCETDQRVQAYEAGMSRMGDSGALKFQIVSSDPGPPIKGSNTFVVNVSSASGDPVESELTVELYMPDHKHGTSVPAEISYDPDSGNFTITPLYLFMAGVWRVTLSAYTSAADPDSLLDSTIFHFCIEG